MDREAFLRIFLKNHSLNEMVQMLSTQLSLPLMVADNGFRVVSSFETGQETPEFRRAVSHSELPVSLYAEINRCFRDPQDEFGEISTADGSYRISCLKSDGVALGYLIYETAGKNSAYFDGGDREFAEALIAKQFYCERHSGSMPADTAEELITDLLDGEFSDRRLFELKAAGTFLSHFRPECFAVFSGVESLTDPARLRDSIRRNFSASLPFFYRGRLILFLHQDHDMEELRAMTEHYRLCAVVSGKPESLYDIKKEWDSVSLVLDYVAQKRQPPFFVFAGDYALPVLLRKILRETPFSDERVRRLAEYDEREGSELCLTLFTYLICSHSLQKTGERLFTHRNTVAYRMKKIREEFEIDPEKPEEITGLLLSTALQLVRSGREDLFLPEKEDRPAGGIAD